MLHFFSFYGFRLCDITLKCTINEMFSLLKKVSKFPIVMFPFNWYIIASFLYCHKDFVQIFFTKKFLFSILLL